jgi:hypothetical protein
MPPRSQGPTNVTLFVAYEIERAREQELATFADLARKWGVTRAHLANITNHLTGVGSDFEQKLANAWTGGSVDELRRRADEWRKANPTWTPKAVGERKADPTKPIRYIDVPGAEEALTECLKTNARAEVPVPDYWFHGALTMPVHTLPPSGRMSVQLLRVLAQLWYLTATREAQAAVELAHSPEASMSPRIDVPGMKPRRLATVRNIRPGKSPA